VIEAELLGDEAREKKEVDDVRRDTDEAEIVKNKAEDVREVDRAKVRQDCCTKLKGDRTRGVHKFE